MLQVMAQWRPALHKVLDHSDELFALLMFVLEAHSLQSTGKSCPIKCLISTK